MITYRDAIAELSPRWLRIFAFERLLYAFGLLFDAIADAAYAALYMAFPGRYSSESLPTLGKDRAITRISGESDEGYAARLISWLDVHKYDGGSIGLLSQLKILLAGKTNLTITIVGINGDTTVMQPDGTIACDGIAWDWDAIDFPARYWVIIKCDEWMIHGTASDPGIYTNQWAIGGTYTYQETIDVCAIVRTNNPPHARCECIVIDLDGNLMSNLPSGNWDSPKERYVSAEYWSI